MWENIEYFEERRSQSIGSKGPNGKLWMNPAGEPLKQALETEHNTNSSKVSLWSRTYFRNAASLLHLFKFIQHYDLCCIMCDYSLVRGEGSVPQRSSGSGPALRYWQVPELSWGTAAWFISSVNCFHFTIDAPSGKKKEMGEGRLLERNNLQCLVSSLPKPSIQDI